MAITTFQRSAHSATVRDSLTPKQLKRLIRNHSGFLRTADDDDSVILDVSGNPWSNGQDPYEGLNPSKTPWRASASGLVAVEPGQRPPHAPGFNVGLTQRNAPLMVDATRAATGHNPNTMGTTVHLALSRDPKLWVQLQALDTVDGISPTYDASSMTHTGVYGPGSELKRSVGPASMGNVVKLPEGSTLSPRFSVRQPDGFAFVISDDKRSISFLDAGGVEYLRTKRTSGWWGNEDPTHADGFGDVLLEDAGTIQDQGETLRVFAKTKSGSAWLAAAGPSWMDDFLVISGTTDIEDAGVESDIPTNNYGGSLGVHTGLTSRHFVRILQSALPDGSVSLFQAKHNIFFSPGSTASGTFTYNMHRFKTAQTWVEGSSAAAFEAGASNANSSADPTPWLGGVNGGAPGSASIETAVGGSFTVTLPFTSGPSRLKTVTLPNVWPVEWRSGAHSPYGYIIVGASGTPGTRINISASEFTTAPTFEITYSLVVSGMSNRLFLIGGWR